MSKQSCLPLPKVISVISQQLHSFQTCQILFTPRSHAAIFLSLRHVFVPRLSGVILFSSSARACASIVSRLGSQVNTLTDKWKLFQSGCLMNQPLQKSPDAGFL